MSEKYMVELSKNVRLFNMRN